jgi:hypothetical protein
MWNVEHDTMRHHVKPPGTGRCCRTFRHRLSRSGNRRLKSRPAHHRGRADTTGELTRTGPGAGTKSPGEGCPRQVRACIRLGTI